MASSSGSSLGVQVAQSTPQTFTCGDQSGIFYWQAQSFSVMVSVTENIVFC